MLPPLVILALGVFVVVSMVLFFRVNAFLALITAAMLVSILAPAEFDDKGQPTYISRVAEAFGSTSGSIGIVIALAAIIGKCLMDSGAADKIVRSAVKLSGERLAPVALMLSGFILSVPVFFDTVFYLLVPLARSLWKKTRKNYILYVTSIACGGAITHTLVPPTPGPLFMANELGVDLGMMILIGSMIAFPAAIVGLGYCLLLGRWMEMPMRPYVDEVESDPLPDDELPPLWFSLLPVILPVLLISANTIAIALDWKQAGQITAVLGNPNFALLISTAIAIALVIIYRKTSLREMATGIEKALMSGGVIILITAGGGAFGAMLRKAGIQEAVESFVGTSQDSSSTGIVILLSAFVVASVLKFAQGSGTVSMITTVSIFSAMGVTTEAIGCHLVYLATAIGAGSLVGSWMNDSGFWVFAKMSSLTEVESLKSWTTLLAVAGVASLVFTLLFSRLMPLIPAT